MYPDKHPFEYAYGYYGVFPRGIEEGREIGSGSIVVEDDYVLYFRPETPDEIKERLIKDYAEYNKARKAERTAGIYRD